MIEEKELKIPCEIFTRVVGYYRPISQFNKGKQEEYWDRARMKQPDMGEE